MSQKWIIKDSLDQVSGPFETSEVIRRIHQGLVSEEDFLASYPEGKWIPITRNQIFFDEMLAAISRTKIKKDPIQDMNQDVKSKEKAEDPIKEETLVKTEALSKTVKIEKTKPISENFKNGSIDEDLEKTEIIDKSQEKTQSINKKKSINKEATQVTKRTGVDLEAKKPHQMFSRQEVLDLRKHGYQTFIDKRRKEISIVIVVVSFLGALWFLLPTNENDILGDSFKLRAPRFNKNPISKNLEEISYKNAIEKIKKGSFKNFAGAYNDLIKVLESNGQNIDALSMLCFTNYHLWEFTQKTSKDLFAVSAITKKAVEMDRFGEKGRICRFVDLTVRGKYQEAQKVVDDVLDSEQGATSVIFSYFNGVLKIFKKEYIAAEGYLSAAISRSRKKLNSEFGQEFAVIWVALADANLKLGKSNLAYKSSLQAILINSEYIDAYLVKGIIEYRNQKKNKLAKVTLQTALDFLDKDKPNKKKLSEAYVVLAEIALFERRRSNALKYAIAAYNYNPGNSVAKNLAIELGGNRKVGKREVLSQQLVIEGEQNLQESGCGSAQAFFKEAYKLDSKNGYAALKTSQCMWELSFTSDAIEWIEKAIQSDPSLIEAYVTAAKYYTERYDFDSALQVLLKAKKVSPRSFEVYRGLAQLELKRQNPRLAIEYAKVALKIYDADTDTLVIMARAYSDLNDNQEAFQYIVRASENDSRNVDVHTMYGKILYKVQGIFAAQEYLKNRIASDPLESAYRVTLAEIYFEDQKYGEAEQYAREAIEYNEKSKNGYMILAKSLKELNDKKSALNYFLDAFSIDPSDVKPLFEAGQLYIDIQKYDEAIKQFERVLKMNQRYPEIYYNMAKVYFAQRKMDKALEYCKIEIENYPENDKCYILDAEAYFFNGTKQKNKLSSFKTKNIDPNDLVRIDNERKITYNKMISYYKLCAESYQKAIDVANQPAALYIDLSRCYRFAGEFDMSQKIVEKALEIEKGNPLVWRENGLLFEQKGEYALALEAYKQYLILNPSASDRNEVVSQMKILESKITP